MRVKKARNGSAVEPSSDDPVDQRLSLIEGQVIGIRKMTRENRNCVDIVTQVAAVRAALDQVGVELLTRHLNDCTRGEGCLTASDAELSVAERKKLMKTALNRLVK